MDKQTLKKANELDDRMRKILGQKGAWNSAKSFYVSATIPGCGDAKLLITKEDVDSLRASALNRLDKEYNSLQLEFEQLK